MAASESVSSHPESPGGRRKAAEMVPSMYEQLRSLAAKKMANEAPGQTIGATALVHEAYLRVAGSGEQEQEAKWENRGHFYVAAATAMRRILIDRARRKKAIRHGGEWQRTEFDIIDAPAAVVEPSDELLALDEALAELAEEDPRKARLVELRYFVGLTSQEAADVLGVSKPTADRDWTFARAWLHQRVRGQADS
jgi:RNA polymerase sigma factor (TIGR02999 family)